MTPATLAGLLRARAERAPAVVATRLRDGLQVLLLAFEASDPEQGSDPVRLAAAACVREGRSRALVLGDEEWFFHLHAPAPLLILIGAVHLAQELAKLARQLGVDVSVIDPRAQYATPARFAGVSLHCGWPDAVLAGLRPDRSSAVVALSHDPKIDDPGLIAALATPCGYIGALGSRRSQAARLARLAEQGVAAAALARILGPVGLAIGAVGAGEIAVSILAEWIAVRRGGEGRAR